MPESSRCLKVAGCRDARNDKQKTNDKILTLYTDSIYEPGKKQLDTGRREKEVAGDQYFVED
jgi:hypothetical protein